MTTKHYNRPDTASPVGGETGLTNRDKFQQKSATIPKIPMSSEDHDSELNYLIDAVNELFDTAISGSVPDNSITLAKLAHLVAGSMYYMNGTGVPTELAAGAANQVLTMSGGIPSWAASTTVPVASVFPYAGSSAPSGYLLADGSDVSRSTYSDLFSAVSTTYGVGDGSTTFGLPDMRGRVPAGIDDMGGSSANIITDPAADTIGGEMGAETHTTDGHALTEAEMPAHAHTAKGNGSHVVLFDASNSFSTGGSSFSDDGTVSRSGHVESTGGDVAHSHEISGDDALQPSLFLNYIIKT